MLGRITTLIGAGALAFAGLTAAVPATAGAAEITVTSTADDGGTGTLRYAVETLAVNGGGDTVVLAAGATYQLDDCSSGQLAHGATPLVIEGNGSTIEQTCADERVLDQGDATLILRDVTITGGDLSAPGAGVRSDGDVTIERSTIRDNASGTLSAGGGVSVFGDSDLTIIESTFTGNSARNGGGAAAGGTVTIVNSTFTGNAADGGPGTGVGGAIELDTAATLAVAYSTFVDNTAGSSAGGIYAGSETTVTFFANVVSGSDCYTGNGGTAVVDNGYNVADATGLLSCQFSETTDVETSDVMLGLLADNGGPTQTMLPATGSPVVDVVPAAACQTAPATGVTADQRLLARPGVEGGACDAGAVELQPEATPPTPGDLEPTFTG